MENNGKTYCVYMHITPNGKKYIGITSRKAEKRWGHGTGYKNNAHFWNAIKKYSWESIEHLIIGENLTRDDACAMEKALIAQHKTNNPRYGYNLTTGGESYEFSDEVITRLRKPKNISAECREQMRERGKEHYKKYLVNRKQTAEQIEKMAKAKRGKKQSRELVEKRADAIRRTYEERGGFSEEHKRKLSEANKGRTYTEETLQRMRIANRTEKNKRSRAVIQMKDGNVLRTYASAREAMRQTGIQYTSIVRVCNGTIRKDGYVRKKAGGFEWRYAQ